MSSNKGGRFIVYTSNFLGLAHLRNSLWILLYETQKVGVLISSPARFRKAQVAGPLKTSFIYVTCIFKNIDA
jgi:hypothetical protein